MKTLASDRALVTSWLLALAGVPVAPAALQDAASAPSLAPAPASRR